MLGEHIVPQSEVIRAILLDDSPCVLRGLTWLARNCSSHSASVLVARASENVRVSPPAAAVENTPDFSRVCRFADAPSPCLLTRPLKEEGGAAEL